MTIEFFYSPDSLQAFGALPHPVGLKDWPSRPSLLNAPPPILTTIFIILSVDIPAAKPRLGFSLPPLPGLGHRGQFERTTFASQGSREDRSPFGAFLFCTNAKSVAQIAVAGHDRFHKNKCHYKDKSEGNFEHGFTNLFQRGNVSLRVELSDDPLQIGAKEQIVGECRWGEKAAWPCTAA